MDYLIPIVNKLQDVFGAIGQSSIDLPQIIVVGSQSEGKSSVLEGLVGRDFLPRGGGVVTRRPLILQLYCIPSESEIRENAAKKAGNGNENEKASSTNGKMDTNIDVTSTPIHDNSNKNARKGDLSESDKQQAPNTNGTTTSSLSSGSVSSYKSRAPSEEYGEFLHLPGQRFYDFSEIRAEIHRETERTTGKNRGISNRPIHLKIYSPHVLNLTLVDLPGITKVPTGDQPEDVEEQVRSMCYEFISNPNAIILAVTAANHDIVNSDGLKMARAVDPEGERTIGVLTKTDIMDHGTDCTEVLSNRVIPLRRGYIAVMNRSQKDIHDEVSIRAGLSKELNYFQKHPKYRTMLSKCGTANLARTLNQILMLHIRDCLPDIKSRIMSMMVTVQANITALGEPTDTLASASLGATLLQILSKFARAFANSVEGKESNGGAVELGELCGGARISYIFNEVFGKSLKSLSPFEGLSDEDIRTAIANANGPRPSLFVPEIAFDLLVKKQIEKLLQPGLQCVDLVFDEMQRMAFQSENQELSRFPELRDRLFEIVQNQLRSCVQPTQKMIHNLISVELAYINTSHPDFIGGKQAVAQLNKKFQQQQQQQAKSSMSVDPPTVPGKENIEGSNSNITTNNDGMKLLNKDGSDGINTALTTVNNGQNNGNMENSNNGKSFFNIFKPNNNNENYNPQRNNGIVAHAALSSTPQNDHDMKDPFNQSMSSEFHPNRMYNNHTAMRQSSNSTRDPSLVRLPQVPDKMRSGGGNSPTDRERVETEIIKALISSYFDIVKKNFMDLVPKTIMHFLVNCFKENLQNELVKELYKENIMSDLMRETEDVASRRKACREMKELLRRGLEIVNEVRDFNTFK